MRAAAPGNAAKSSGRGRSWLTFNVDALYERCAMPMTSNRGFGDWAEVFGDSVVATASPDRLLHHAVAIPIEGNSYRLREHANLPPEHLRNRAALQTPGVTVTVTFESETTHSESQQRTGWLPITYVGHSAMEHVTVHNSYVYVDQRVGARTSKRAADHVPPTVLDHRKFAYWIGSVAMARSAAETASTLLSVDAGVSSGSAAWA